VIEFAPIVKAALALTGSPAESVEPVGVLKVWPKAGEARLIIAARVVPARVPPI